MENPTPDKLQQEPSKAFYKKIPVLAVSGLLLGGIGGFLYYFFIGCKSGGCAITSNPWISTAWGAAFGYLLFDLFRARKRREK
jgi:hypothetical protein